MMARNRIYALLHAVVAGLLLLSGTALAQDGQGTLKVSTDKGSAIVYLGTQEIGDSPLSQAVDVGT